MAKNAWEQNRQDRDRDKFERRKLRAQRWKKKNPEKAKELAERKARGL
jgi:hypothetical protein